MNNHPSNSSHTFPFLSNIITCNAQKSLIFQLSKNSFSILSSVGSLFFFSIYPVNTLLQYRYSFFHQVLSFLSSLFTLK